MLPCMGIVSEHVSLPQGDGLHQGWVSSPAGGQCCKKPLKSI